MYCRECKITVNNEYIFCPNCGSEVLEETDKELKFRDLNQLNLYPKKIKKDQPKEKKGFLRFIFRFIVNSYINYMEVLFFLINGAKLISYRLHKMLSPKPSFAANSARLGFKLITFGGLLYLIGSMLDYKNNGSGKRSKERAGFRTAGEEYQPKEGRGYRTAGKKNTPQK